MINVAVVEDNFTIREGLKILIDETEKYSCVGAYSKCESLIKNLKKVNPDVVLLDIGLPGMSGIEGIKHIRDLMPDLAILILTVYEENDLIFDALCAGASGYIAKKSPSSRLLDIIQEAYQGSAPMSSNIARKVIDLFKQKKLSGSNGDHNPQHLSTREKEILNKLVEGSSFKAIADSLVVSIETLRSDFGNIYKKIHAYSK